MEINVAQFLSPLTCSVIIIDCNWNMNATSISANVVPLVKYFRSSGHPTTPIVLAEGIAWGGNWVSDKQRDGQLASNAALRGAYTELISGGDTKLWYVTMESLWYGVSDIEMDSPQADGLHPTDAGMRMMAARWIQVLSDIL